MATRAGFEPAVFSVTGRYAKPLHQRALNERVYAPRTQVKVYQGRFTAVKPELNSGEVKNNLS